MAAHTFVGFPAAVLVDADGKAVMQRIWGSYLSLTGERDGEYLEVRMGQDRYWIHQDDTQDRGTLEIMFLDIGQGDGCIVTTPDNRKLIIDAGAGDNMIRFLDYKYKQARKPVHFDAFVITHPDQDHYYGFDPILDSEDYTADAIYHSGLVERAAAATSDSLGKRKKIDGQNYVTELIDTTDDLDRLLTPAKVGKKVYPRMMRKAVDSPRIGEVQMLNSTDEYVPGYGPDAEISLQVLAPVPEFVDGDKPALRWLANLAKTKNGHSVVLRLKFGKFSCLLGGDLNIPAEEYLLAHYTGEEMPPKTVQAEEIVVQKARRVFQSEVAKSCHHGSADFSELFLKAVNAHATVISSGDNEPHAHPRADTLGTVGKHSRGRRSLIFSTELSRSTKELIKNPFQFRDAIRKAAADLEQANLSGKPNKIEAAQKVFDKLLEQIERSVAVFGAINLRTDGERAIFAYKIERPKNNSLQWDIYELHRDSADNLVFTSKHD